MRKLLKLLPLLVLCVVAIAQSPYSVTLFNPVTMTASSQTSTAIVLGQKQGTIWKAGSYASATITLTGSSLTTATFGVTGSSDGGVTYYPIPISAVLTPGTTAATATATAAGMYQVNLAGLTHIKFITSGTFTGTGITLILTASPNALIGRSAGGPAGGCNSGTTTNILQGDGAGGCAAARLSVNTSSDTAVTFTNEGWSYRAIPGNSEFVFAKSYPGTLAGLVGQQLRIPSNGIVGWLNGGANSYSGSTDAQLSRTGAGAISADGTTPGDGLASFKAAAYLGPATAPSGSCSVSGQWVFSQDGHATYCNAGTWATKI